MAPRKRATSANSGGANSGGAKSGARAATKGTATTKRAQRTSGAADEAQPVTRKRSTTTAKPKGDVATPLTSGKKADAKTSRAKAAPRSKKTNPVDGATDKA
jgi:hypothetical protein